MGLGGLLISENRDLAILVGLGIVQWLTQPGVSLEFPRQGPKFPNKGAGLLIYRSVRLVTDLNCFLDVGGASNPR